MWKNASIEDLRLGTDNQIRTVILRQPDTTRISRAVQLVVPLQVDQGGEDVRDWDEELEYLSRLILWFMIHDLIVFCSSFISY
jgi:hypothetical protein